MRKWSTQALACAAALTVAACGGGGGGSPQQPVTDPTTTTQPPTDPTTTTTTTAPVTEPTPGPVGPAAATMVLQGTIKFDSIPAKSRGGGLDYAAVVQKPSRGILVEAVDIAGKSFGTATTDAAGRYSLTLPSNSVVFLRAYATMLRKPGNGDASGWEVAVLDNTALLAGGKSPLQGVEWVPFAVGSVSMTATHSIKSGWSVNPATGVATADAVRPAAPFAILDTIYEAQARVLSALPDTVFPPLAVLWSPRNRPSADFDPASGAIGSSSFYSNDKVGVIFLSGKSDVDTDENDASVIAHEWGHYYQTAFGRNDSVGGSHVTGDLLDAGVAFAEAWGNAWSGIALKTDRYVDTFGPQQAMSLEVDLTAAPDADRGWFNENSVRYALIKLNEAAGLKPILQALAGPFRSVVATTGIHAFNAALMAVSADAASRLAPLLESQRISSTADAWGTGETNNGGSAVALPMVRPLKPGVPATGVCVSNALDPRRDGNKLGQHAYLRFSLASAGKYTVSVQGPPGSNPDFRIINATGVVNRSAASLTASESAEVALAAGDHLLSVNDSRMSSASTCFTVAIQ